MISNAKNNKKYIYVIIPGNINVKINKEREITIVTPAVPSNSYLAELIELKPCLIKLYLITLSISIPLPWHILYWKSLFKVAGEMGQVVYLLLI